MRSVLVAVILLASISQAAYAQFPFFRRPTPTRTFTPIPTVTPTFTPPVLNTFPPTAILPLVTPFCGQCHEEKIRKDEIVKPLPKIARVSREDHQETH